PPTPYNVILRLTDSLGHDVPTGKIPEGPPISLPRDLVQLAANTTQSFSTVINLRDWFPTLAPGTYTLTATYVNLVKDPEVTATGTCPTGSTCFTPLWMGAAP